MKITLLSAVIAVSAVLVGCSEQDVTTIQTRQTRVAPCAKILRHVVLFKFQDSATPEQVKTVVDAFRSLPGSIDVIKGFEYGTDISPEKRAQGFTHCFFLTFTSEADRDTYLNHPTHKAFGAKLRPYIDKVLVVDYWAEK